MTRVLTFAAGAASGLAAAAVGYVASNKLQILHNIQFSRYGDDYLTGNRMLLKENKSLAAKVESLQKIQQAYENLTVSFLGSQYFSCFGQPDIVGIVKKIRNLEGTLDKENQLTTKLADCFRQAKGAGDIIIQSRGGSVTMNNITSEGNVTIEA